MSEHGGTGPVLKVVGLKAYYRTQHFGNDREVKAVDGVDFEVRRNEIYGLAGESSSGKTTLVKTIAAALKPPLEIIAGKVDFAFAPDILRMKSNELDKLRWRHLSYIVQGSMSVFNPVRRIRQSFIDFAFRHIKKPRAEFDRQVEAHLARVQLDPSVLNAYPHELSGGMRQRATIALATICRPDFIIADEPTTALDVIVQKNVLDMIKQIQREMGSSVLMVTHDLGVHGHMADRLGIMYAGRIVEEGPAETLFRNPRHPYTAHLVASLPRIGDATVRKGLEGSPPNLAAPPGGCRFHPRCPLAMARCKTEVPIMAQLGRDHRVACFAVNPPGP
jgi:peptide/nickel transport system ATP-binding protein